MALQGRKINIWFNLLTQNDKSSRNGIAPNISFEIDCYPQGASLESGLIDGLSVLETLGTPLLPSSWTISDTVTSFIPNVLEGLLKAECHGEAVVVASRYSQLSYFDHFLEVLLNKALEYEVEHQTGLLAHTWNLIQNYSHLLSKIVVGVARKCESAYWQTLFSVVGGALDFYEAALSSGDLKTAGAFLVVLYTMNTEMNHEEVCVPKRHEFLD